MEISIKGDPKEIAALVLAVQERQKRDAREIELAIDGQKISQDMSLYRSCPSVDIRLLDDRGRGGDGNSQQSNFRCFVRIEDFKRAIEALNDVKSSLEQTIHMLRVPMAGDAEEINFSAINRGGKTNHEFTENIKQRIPHY